MGLLRSLVLFLHVAVLFAKPRFAKHRGYIAQGADILNGTMTIDKAQEICAGLVECMGITFAAEWDAVWAVGTANFRAQMWLKASDEWVANEGHVSMVKEMPKCDGAKFMRYKKAGHGPYCCEGNDCPHAKGYNELGTRCFLQASTIFGLPKCNSLKAPPLRNVAPEAIASASSEYPYAENSGPGVANDGVINASLFHSQCDGGPHWWRLDWKKPVAVVQVALHNRNEFRARIFGTTVKAYAANGTVIASAVLRASRSRYIWTLRPAIRNVSRLEVRTPPNGDCLHFKEVEVFGAREPPVTKPGDAEAAKLIMDQILPNLEDRAIAREGSGGEDIAGGGDDAGRGGGGDGAGLLAGPGGVATGMAGQSTPAAREGQHAAEPNLHDRARDAPPRVPASPPTPRPGTLRRGGSSRRARGGGSGGGGGGGRMRDGGGGEEGGADDERNWMAMTGSLTTAVLVAVQFCWVKSRWLDCWY